tara:strand:- start:1933 stop:2808 length:876 start_codon:yes stop_codon:yes gene_type:complete
MKIFDCTTYFEEDLMMDVRFNILNEYVDTFIVCESKFSHSGKEKKINFEPNSFPKFKNKIKHIILEKEPPNLVDENIASPEDQRTNSVKRIMNQRDFIQSGLNASADDIIMYSDNDEIPNLENLNFAKIKSKIVIFNQKMFYYKFNLFYPDLDWYGTKCCRYKDLRSISWLREVKPKKYKPFRLDVVFSKYKFIDLKIIQAGGWHFSNVKNLQGLLKKYENDEMHAEYNARNVDSKEIERLLKERKINYNHFKDSKDISRQFSEFSLKKIDIDQLPTFLQNNFKKYSDWFD